jgi:hypothetical protein
MNRFVASVVRFEKVCNSVQEASYSRGQKTKRDARKAKKKKKKKKTAC